LDDDVSFSDRWLNGLEAATTAVTRHCVRPDAGFTVGHERASSSHRHGAVAGEPAGLWRDVRGDRGQSFSRRAAHTQLELPVTALVAIVAASAVTWLVLLFVARLAKKKGGGGFARATMTSFMGLIVLAMGVQFALTGLRQFGL
jgi:hypothetical protein